METSDLLIFYFRDISFSPYIPSICTQEGNSLKSTPLFFFYQISNFLTKLAGVEKELRHGSPPLDLLSLHQSLFVYTKKLSCELFVVIYVLSYMYILPSFYKIKSLLEYTIELSLLFFVYDFKLVIFDIFLLIKI